LLENRLIVTFDSGLGGLTVFRELRRELPDAAMVYVADDSAFPYGRLSEADVVARVASVMAVILERVSPDAIVIACNTASTAVLPHLRSAYPQIDFVGTVPAVKPAAERTKSGLITVLGTSATVRRDYTHELIRNHAAHCDVTLIGSENLAALAEQFVHDRDGCGAAFDEALIRELAPCFIEQAGSRTDHIVLACTHYPLLLERFEVLAGWKTGWPVTFVDPAPAIARRAADVVGNRRRALRRQGETADRVWTTSGYADEASCKLFARFGLSFEADFSLPFQK